MNVEHRESSLIIFLEPRSPRKEGPTPVSQDYCRARERAERAAAKQATSIEARRVHQQMAQAYADLAQVEGKE